MFLPDRKPQKTSPVDDDTPKPTPSLKAKINIIRKPFYFISRQKGRCESALLKHLREHIKTLPELAKRITGETEKERKACEDRLINEAITRLLKTDPDLYKDDKQAYVALRIEFMLNAMEKELSAPSVVETGPTTLGSTSAGGAASHAARIRKITHPLKDPPAHRAAMHQILSHFYCENGVIKVDFDNMATRHPGYGDGSRHIKDRYNELLEPLKITIPDLEKGGHRKLAEGISAERTGESEGPGYTGLYLLKLSVERFIDLAIAHDFDARHKLPDSWHKRWDEKWRAAHNSSSKQVG